MARPAWHTPVDAATRAWIERAAGPGWRVARTGRMQGGIAAGGRRRQPGRAGRLDPTPRAQALAAARLGGHRRPVHRGPRGRRPAAAGRHRRPGARRDRGRRGRRRDRRAGDPDDPRRRPPPDGGRGPAPGPDRRDGRRARRDPRDRRRHPRRRRRLRVLLAPRSRRDPRRGTPARAVADGDRARGGRAGGRLAACSCIATTTPGTPSGNEAGWSGSSTGRTRRGASRRWTSRTGARTSAPATGSRRPTASSRRTRRRAACATDQAWWDVRILLDFIGDEDWSPPHSLATAEAYLEALLARL